MKKWIRNWLNSDINEKTRGSPGTRGEDYVLSRGSTQTLCSPPVTFSVYKADGGHVVEVRQYDRKIDETRNSIYLITHDQSFGERIEHILTVEALKL